jgi:hypothetical protein
VKNERIYLGHIRDAITDIESTPLSPTTALYVHDPESSRLRYRKLAIVG